MGSFARRPSITPTISETILSNLKLKKKSRKLECAIPFPPGDKKIKIRFFFFLFFFFFSFSNSQSIYNNTSQPECMYSTTLTHVALKKLSGHKGCHHF